MASGLMVPLVLGCSSEPCVLPVGPPPGAVALEACADWNDVQAAVAAALAGSELVKVRLERPDPARLVYTLRSSRDEPAVLTVERLTDGPDPVQLRATCSIGRFGDAAREREFLALVIARLGQLQGVEVAPLDDPAAPRPAGPVRPPARSSRPGGS